MAVKRNNIMVFNKERFAKQFDEDLDALEQEVEQLRNRLDEDIALELDEINEVLTAMTIFIRRLSKRVIYQQGANYGLLHLQSSLLESEDKERILRAIESPEVKQRIEESLRPSAREGYIESLTHIADEDEE